MNTSKKIFLTTYLVGGTYNAYKWSMKTQSQNRSTKIFNVAFGFAFWPLCLICDVIDKITGEAASTIKERTFD